MSIRWQPACCAWHGQYAEAKAKNGGMLRLKRADDFAGVLCTRFDADGKALDKDADGIPVYVQMTESEAQALLG